MEICHEPKLSEAREVYQFLRDIATAGARRIESTTNAAPTSIREWCLPRLMPDSPIGIPLIKYGTDIDGLLATTAYK